LLAEALVDAVAEGQVLGGVPVHVKRVGIGESRRVAVGGLERDGDRLARLGSTPAAAYVARISSTLPCTYGASRPCAPSGRLAVVVENLAELFGAASPAPAAKATTTHTTAEQAAPQPTSSPAGSSTGSACSARRPRLWTGRPSSAWPSSRSA
jgi:hypothetical protein